MEDEPKSESDSNNGVYYFDIRWTLPPKPLTGYDYDGIAKSFRMFLSAITADRYIFQFECNNPLTGVNTHIQCSAHLKVKNRQSTVLNALITHTATKQPGPCYHVAVCSTNGRDALAKYTMKPNSRINGPYADHPIYMGQDLPNIHDLKPWQARIFEEAGKEDIEKRTINWVFDQGGNTGKTTICKYLQYHHQIPTINFATARHMMDVIAANRYKPMYCFDLTRTKPAEVKMDDLYSVLEQIKNGQLTKTMNKPEQWMQMPARVWVFSNYKPDLAKLSTDRFKIWEIAEGELTAITD